MDVNKIVQFRIKKEDYTPPIYSDLYQYETIDINNYKSNLDRLLNITKLIDKQIVWEGNPNTEEKLLKRFQSESVCQLWIYDGVDIGWYWYNNNFTYDWINIIQTLNKNEHYVGGAFCSNQVSRPPDCSFIFYNFSFINAFDNLGKDTVYIYGDDWNRASNILMYKSGCEQYNFIKETK